jgi:hypothetical protein
VSDGNWRQTLIRARADARAQQRRLNAAQAQAQRSAAAAAPVPAAASASGGGDAKGVTRSKTVLYVDNLERPTRIADLRAHFAACGRVLKVNINRRIGFIVMETPEGAARAVARLNGVPLNGRPLDVSLKLERYGSGAPRNLVRDERDCVWCVRG